MVEAHPHGCRTGPHSNHARTLAHTQPSPTRTQEWGRAADYCLANEDFLYAYELAQSNPNPNPNPNPDPDPDPNPNP